MPRWTQNTAEALHLSEMAADCPVFGIVEAATAAGQVVEGVIRGQGYGNNAGRPGTWSYYGQIRLQMLNGEMVDLDLLDVKTIREVTAARQADYIAAGLFHVWG